MRTQLTSGTFWPYLLLLTFSCYSLGGAPRSPTTTPKPPNAATFKDARFITDIFPFQVAFSLEQNNEILFENPKVALMTETGYFVSNDKGDRLVRYHLDGSYDRTVAVAGEGPGELGRLSFATKIFDGHVGFYDIGRSQILAYSEKGDYLWSLNLRSLQLENQTVLAVGSAFAWPKRDALLLTNVHHPNKPETQGVKCRVSWRSPNQISELTPLAWINNRPIEFEKKFGYGVVDQLAVLGNVYWVGCNFLPEFAMIDDQNEPRLLRTQKITTPRALTKEHYSDLDASDRRALMRLRNLNGTIHKMLVFDQTVWIKVGAIGWVPFDHQGNQLSKNRIKSRIGRFMDARGDTAMVIALRRHVEQWASFFDESFSTASDHDDADPDQPMILLMRLKTPYR
ncbi:hypothetical protein [Acanthopleuribacter pedis]|uniref:6-bladed beta-propeller n=1 Tax=Acanthopleuribacter pedis TaxID=442870 RepID=A0A8J7U7G4_9BACT|nr:hypothetical protein [Acanthopleuribacter pedis]MBO1321381.1 hypothetical protein [Acanthopleuribacter pedis]